MLEKNTSNLLQSVIDAAQPRLTGMVQSMSAHLVNVTGPLAAEAVVGQPVTLLDGDKVHAARVVDIKPSSLRAQVIDKGAALRVGATAILSQKGQLYPSEAWLSRVILPDGRAFDGEPLGSGSCGVSLEEGTGVRPIPFVFDVQMQTGISLFNTVLPLAVGQRLGIFAGPGVGKTMLLRAMMARTEADVIVLTLVGERRREIEEWRKTLPHDVMAKTIIVAAPSDAPSYQRRQGAFTAMGIAEYFRDQGKHVLFLCDSVTRLAEAHRELSADLGEMPVMRGYPPSLVGQLTELTERAGKGAKGGAITALFSVLVAGGDFDEPVSDIMRGILDGHVILSPELAARGIYPAVDLLHSVSRSTASILDSAQRKIAEKARHIVSVYEENKLMVQSGLYVSGRDVQIDEAIAKMPALQRFLTQMNGASVKADFDALAALLSDA